MGEWRRVRIGDICDIVKGETGLASATPGTYPLVATGAERRSCSSYQFDTEAVCIPLVSSTGHGKKTLNYVHYQSGKFALGTILAAVIPKNPQILTARYLHLYLSHFKDTVLVPLMKGAANVSLPIKGIASVTIPVPPVDDQQKLIDLIGRTESEHRELLAEGERQDELFKQLRQTVLQDAVEGKLTADWRKQHPVVKGDPQYDAVALLTQIKAEKDRLIKVGKIRKEKPLPPITDKDKPFKLPERWVWCRLDSISNKIHYGYNASAKQEKKDIRLLRITDIQNNKVNWETVPGCDYSNNDIANYLLSINDIVIARTGGTIGKSFLVKDLPVKSLFASYLIRVVPVPTINVDFLKIFLECPFYWRQLSAAAWGAGQPNVNGSSLSKLVLSLPPLAEQQAIVARVNSLMAVIDELGQQVYERKEQAQMLMQAVLREAFNHQETSHMTG